MKNESAVALGQMRLGIKERPSETKRIAVIRNLKSARSRWLAMTPEERKHKHPKERKPKQIEKLCSHCRTIKPAMAFNVAINGRLASWCKVCLSKQRAENRASGKIKNPNDEATKAKWRNAQKLYHSRHPEKARARQAIANAIAAGKIVKPDHCERCNQAVKVQAHHDDYSKPFEVRWLCRPCHCKQHREAKWQAWG